MLAAARAASLLGVLMIACAAPSDEERTLRTFVERYPCPRHQEFRLRVVGHFSREEACALVAAGRALVDSSLGKPGLVPRPDPAHVLEVELSADHPLSWRVAFLYGGPIGSAVAVIEQRTGKGHAKVQQPPISKRKQPKWPSPSAPNAA